MAKAGRPKGSVDNPSTTKARRQLFIKAYLTPGPAYFQAGKAAIASGYNFKSIGAARVQGSRMLQLPEVQKALATYTEKANQETKLSQEELFRHLGSVVRADLRRYYNADGVALAPHEWTSDMAAAVSSIEVDETRNSKGEVTGRTSKIKLWPKMDAIDKAMRHLGLFEKDNRQKSDNLAIQINLVGPPRTPEPTGGPTVVLRPNLLGNKR